jgi:hypothetical protein
MPIKNRSAVINWQCRSSNWVAGNSKPKLKEVSVKELLAIARNESGYYCCYFQECIAVCTVEFNHPGRRICTV